MLPAPHQPMNLFSPVHSCGGDCKTKTPVMKTKHLSHGILAASLGMLLAGSTVLSASELITDGSFDTSSSWTVVPPQTGWTCIAGGEANLHPLGSYTGPIVTQALSIPGAGGRKLHFTGTMTKLSAPAGSTIAFVLDYLDTADVPRQLTILQPGNDSITWQTVVSADVFLPLEAKTITGFGVHKTSYGAFSLQSASLDLLEPPLDITSPAAGSVFEMDDTVVVTVSLDPSITGPRTVRIQNNGTFIGTATPTSFIHGWKFPDGSIIGFQSATMFNYVHEDEYFFFDGAFTNSRFAGNFSAHSIGGMATGTGTLDFSFDSSGLLAVTTSGDAPLGTRNLSGGKSTTCASYRFAWRNPPAGLHSLSAVVSHADNTSGLTRTLASLPVSITVNGPPASPEIVMEQPLGTSLTDGADTRGFGNAVMGSTGILKTFTIRNNGTAGLSGLAVSKDGPHAADFTIGPLPKTSLAVGESTSFPVTFQPGAKGARTAAIHIASNDPDENPFDVNLTGVGLTAPEIALEQPAGKGLTDAVGRKSFGLVKVGKSGKARIFTIRNKGTAKLTGLAITKNGANAKDFIVTSPVKSTLAPNTSTTFRVTFKPRARGTRNAAIQIRSNDVDENPFDIKLTGTGANR